MGDHLLGQICALGAAFVWAFALILFKRSGERISPLALNLFKNVVGIVLLAATLAALGPGLATLSGFPREDLWILLFSGVVGVALADTIFFHSLNLIGVGMLSIVDCLYSPFVVLFSWAFLFEQLSLVHYVGGGLIVSGVFISTRHAPPPGRTRAQLVAGVLLGALSMALMAAGIVIAKPVLDVAGFPLIWATLLRLLAGTLVLALLALASPQRKTLWSVFRPSSVWKVCLPGSILGAYVAMILWIAGFKYTYASIAGLLNQTTVVFSLVLATLLLNERFTRRKAVAVTLAMVGVVIVTLNAP